MIYFNLFTIFFKIGLFSFGGGYAILPLIQREVVEKYSWINYSEFTEMVALSQITPGPIAINMATHVGYKIANTLGSTVATIGVVCPSIIIISIIVLFLKKFNDSVVVKRSLKSLRLTVVGLILGAAVTLVVRENFIDMKSYIIFLIIILLGFFTKVGSIALILISGVLGFLFYYL